MPPIGLSNGSFSPIDLQPWKDSRGNETFFTKAEEISALWELASKEFFGGKLANQVFWKANEKRDI
jgi:hypothetical protein